MSNPSDLKYTKEHEWIRDKGNGTATIGVTDFAQGELGDVVFVELKPKGTTFEQDEIFGTIEAVKTVSELFAPVGGEIIEINEEIEINPATVNHDPFGKGWMVKIKVDDESELDDLLSAEEYDDITD